MNRRAKLLIASTLAVLGTGLGPGAPYIGAEVLLRQHGARVQPPPKIPLRGRWFDDYFVIEEIDATTFAIGEPRYYQGNYSYLIVGRDHAVLFDAGTGSRDIVPVVRALTTLPVTVLPSHLHFDHVGALGRFEHAALLDAPDLKGRTSGGVLALRRYEFLGFADSLPERSFRVDQWWPAGEMVELGGRRVEVMWMPGHTPTSVGLYDAERHQLFAGDFIYPSQLYAFVPGASRADYLATTRRLLATLDPATRIYAAHMADDPPMIEAPLLEIADLRALERALVAIESGQARATGWYPRVFPVRGPIGLATGFSWNNR